MKEKLPFKFYLGTLIMFFCSGLSSLIYQVIWIRQLSLAVGSTSASMSLVLSIFFLGLAGGSFLVGKFHHKIKNPLLAYGKLEGFIGLYSAVLVYILFHFQTLLVWAYPQGEILLISQLIKFTLVFLSLILPTLAMGATLPLLIKSFENATSDLSVQKSSVSLMYGINTLGAVAGSLISGFVLIPAIGIEYSNHISVFLNFCLFASSLWLSQTLSDPSHITTSSNSVWLANLKDDHHTFPTQSKFNTFKSKLYLFISAACGFATISAEVVWNKYLGIFMGTNIYGLSLILSVFLLGIGIGSLTLPKLRQWNIAERSKVFLFILLFTLVLTLWISTLLLGSLPFITTVITHYIYSGLTLLQIKFLVTTLILFAPTFISGMILPYVIGLLHDEINDLPFATGSIYSINTVGSILGSYCSGVFLIPLIGSAWTLKLALNLLLIVLFLTFFTVLSDKGPILKKRTIPPLLLLILLATGINSTESLHFRDILRSAYHQSYTSISNFSDILKIFSDQQEEFIKLIEGETAVISLSHDQADGPEYRRYFRLKTNGLNESVYDSQNKDALPKYEALLGLLPYLLVEKPENAFLVGYGGGFSTHFFGSTDLKNVLVAELEKGIIDAANFVWKGNNPVLKHENINLKIEDARFLLAVGTGAPYDIIGSQPSHSWLSGVANLFTLEFFELVKSRLKPKGVFSQWLNLYNIDEEVLKSILKTFYTVFPNGAIFTDLQDDEVILIGSMEPLNFSVEKANLLLTSPRLQPLLQKLSFRNGYDLLTQMTLTRSDVLKITEFSPLNTDRNAFAETRQSRLFYNPQDKVVQQFLDDHFAVSYSELFSDTPIQQDHWTEILKALNEKQNYTKYNKVLDKKKEVFTDPWELAKAYYQMERYDSAKQVLLKEPAIPQSTGHFNFTLQLLNSSEDYTSAIQFFTAHKNQSDLYSLCLALESQLQINHLLEAKIIVNRLEKNFQRSLSYCGDYLYYYLGQYYTKAGGHQKAISYLDYFYRRNPQQLSAIKYLIGSLIASDLNASSFAFMKEAETLRQQEIYRLESLSSYYKQIQAFDDAQILDQKRQKL